MSSGSTDAPRGAVVRRQVLTEVREIENAIDVPQQVVPWHDIV
jgi:hypothetical protein